MSEMPVEAPMRIASFPSIERVNVFTDADFPMVYETIPAAYGMPPRVRAVYVPREAFGSAMASGAGSAPLYASFHRVLSILRACMFRADEGTCSMLAIAIPRGRDMENGELAGIFFALYERDVPPPESWKDSVPSRFAPLIDPGAQAMQLATDAATRNTEMLGAIVTRIRDNAADAMEAVFRRIRVVEDIFGRRAQGRAAGDAGAERARASERNKAEADEAIAALVDVEDGGDTEDSRDGLVTLFQQYPPAHARMGKVAATAERECARLMEMLTALQDIRGYVDPPTAQFMTAYAQVAMRASTQLTALEEKPPVVRVPSGLSRSMYHSCSLLSQAVRIMEAAQLAAAELFDAATRRAAPAVPFAADPANKAAMLMRRLNESRYKALAMRSSSAPMHVYLRDHLWGKSNTVSATTRNGAASEWREVVDMGASSFFVSVGSVLCKQRISAEEAMARSRAAAEVGDDEDLFGVPPSQQQQRQLGVVVGRAQVDIEEFLNKNLSIESAYATYVAYERGHYAEEGECRVYAMDEIFTYIDVACGRFEDNLRANLRLTDIPKKGGEDGGDDEGVAGGGDAAPARGEAEPPAPPAVAGDKAPPLVLLESEEVVAPVQVPRREFSGCVTVLTQFNVTQANWLSYRLPVPGPPCTNLAARYAPTIAGAVSALVDDAPGDRARSSMTVMRMLGACGASGSHTIDFLELIDQHAERLSGQAFTAETRSARNEICPVLDDCVRARGHGIPKGIIAHATEAARLSGTAFDFDPAARDRVVVSTSALMASHRLRYLEAALSHPRVVTRQQALTRAYAHGRGDSSTPAIQLSDANLISAIARIHMQHMHAMRASVFAHMMHPSDATAVRASVETDHAAITNVVAPTRDLTLTEACIGSGVTTYMFGGDMVFASRDRANLSHIPARIHSVGGGVSISRPDGCTTWSASRYAPMPFAFAMQHLGAAHAYSHGAPHQIGIYTGFLSAIAGVTMLHSRNNELRPNMMAYGGPGTGKSHVLATSSGLVPKGGLMPATTTSAKGDQVYSELAMVRISDEAGAEMGATQLSIETFDRTLEDPRVADTANADQQRIQRIQMSGGVAMVRRAMANNNGRVGIDERQLHAPGAAIGGMNFLNPVAVPAPTRNRAVWMMVVQLRDSVAESRARTEGGVSYHEHNRLVARALISASMRQIHAFSYRYALLERAHVVPATCMTINSKLVRGVYTWLDAYGIHPRKNTRDANAVQTYAQIAMTARVTMTLRMVGVHAPSRPVDTDAGLNAAKISVVTIEDTCAALDVTKTGGEPFHIRLMEVIYELLVARLELIKADVTAEENRRPRAGVAPRASANVFDAPLRRVVGTGVPGRNIGSVYQAAVMAGAPPAQPAVHAAGGIDCSVDASERVPTNVSTLAELIECAGKNSRMTSNGFIQLTSFVNTGGSDNNVLGGNVMELNDALSSERSGGHGYGGPNNFNIQAARLSTLISFRKLLDSHPAVIRAGVSAEDVWAFIGWCIVNHAIPSAPGDGTAGPILVVVNRQIFVNPRVLVACLASSWHTAVCASVGSDIATHTTMCTTSELETYTELSPSGELVHTRVSPALAIAPIRQLPSTFRENIAALSRHIDVARLRANPGSEQAIGAVSRGPVAPNGGPEQKDSATHNAGMVTNEDVVNAHWSHLTKCFDGNTAIAKLSFGYIPTMMELASSMTGLRAAIVRANGADVCTALGQHMARLAVTVDGYQRAWTERDVGLFLCAHSCTCGFQITTTIPMDHTGEKEDYTRQGEVLITGSAVNFVRLAHAVVVTEVNKIRRERRLAPPPVITNPRVDYTPETVAIAMQQYAARCARAPAGAIVPPEPTAQTAALYVSMPSADMLSEELSASLRKTHFRASVSHDRHDRDLARARHGGVDAPRQPVRPAPVEVQSLPPVSIPPAEDEFERSLCEHGAALDGNSQPPAQIANPASLVRSPDVSSAVSEEIEAVLPARRPARGSEEEEEEGVQRDPGCEEDEQKEGEESIVYEEIYDEDGEILSIVPRRCQPSAAKRRRM